MHDNWAHAAQLKNDQAIDIWAVDHTALPMLDPAFPARASRKLSFLQRTYDRIRNDDQAYRRELARLLHPLGHQTVRAQATPEDLVRISEYLREADVYLCATTRLLPSDLRDRVQLRREVAECQDMRELLALFFEGQDARCCYEAQRKINLAQLLLDIDHSRHIQDGLRHKEYFENLLRETLWRHTRQVHELEIGFHISQDGESIEFTSRPDRDDQLWNFHSIFLQKKDGKRSISLDILYYNCRFKRSVEPISFEIIDGQHRVLEKVRWQEMRQYRSGSILSKMIRKGISDPDVISDLIGAMFIVHDEDSLNDLLSVLDSCIGNPFGWRNITDTLASDRDRATLGRHSGRGYRVFKGDMDILTPRRTENDPPYRFPVEIQIHTLESFLRTVCGAHEASHHALKLRQFLHGLVPKLFPREIYGEDWLKLD